MDDERNILKQKVEAFKEAGTLVHITYKKNCQWKNGVIKKIKENHFILDERLQGEILVFFDEINDLWEYNGVLK